MGEECNISIMRDITEKKEKYSLLLKTALQNSIDAITIQKPVTKEIIFSIENMEDRYIGRISRDITI